MRRLSLFVTLVFGMWAFGCGGDDDSAPGPDTSGADSMSGGPDSMSGGPDSMYLCGVGPGTPGNNMGVGQYCDGLTDCFGNDANICATLGDPNAHFCTKTCDAMGSPDQCGDMGAICNCSGGSQCGCVPASCGGP